MPRFHAKCKFPPYAPLIAKSLGKLLQFNYRWNESSSAVTFPSEEACSFPINLGLFAGLLLNMKIHNLSSEDPVIQLEHHSGYKDSNARYGRTLNKRFTDTLCV